MITRLRYKRKPDTDRVFITASPVLIGADLVNVQIEGDLFRVITVDGKEIYYQNESKGNHSMKKAVKKYLRNQGVHFADEVRRRKEKI